MASFEQRYELLEVWGRGTHGTVWKARARRTGRTVAVKRVRRDPRAPADPWKECLRREAELLGRVRHPGIVEVIEVGIGLDEAWLVTEFVEGGSLEDLLRARGRLAPLEAAAIVARAARALDAAHRAGVVHRDVKPGNLLLAPDGEVKVTDFGIAARPGEAAAGEDPGLFVGTPAYTAPEQLRGEPVDGRGDTWSLGVVLWRCLAGEPPFRGLTVAETVHRVLHDPVPDPADVLPGTPPAVREVLRWSLEKDPDRRPPSALAFARALEEAIVADSGEGEEPPPDRGFLPGRGAPRTGGIAAFSSGEEPAVAGEGRWAGILAAAGLALGVLLLAGVPRDREKKQPGVVAPAGPGASAGVTATSCGGGRETALARAAALAGSPGDDRLFRALGSALACSRGIDEAGPPAAPDRRGETTGPRRASARRRGGGERFPGGQGRRKGRKRGQKRTRPRRVASPEVPGARPPRGGGPSPGAGTSRPAPRPARQELPAAPGEAPAGKPRPAAQRRPGRGVVEVRHRLPEGVVEVLVDGRRVGLVRVGPGTPFPPGTPVTVAFSVSPGEHRLLLRVLSASARLEVERHWRERWAPDGFRARKWRLTGGAGAWELVPAP